MVHHVQGSMADGVAGARAERAVGEAGGGGWPTASRIDAQQRPAGEAVGEDKKPKSRLHF